MLFEVDKIGGKIMECLDKALKVGMRGRVFEGYNFGSLLRMLRYIDFRKNNFIIDIHKSRGASALHFGRAEALRYIMKFNI